MNAFRLFTRTDTILWVNGEKENRSFFILYLEKWETHLEAKCRTVPKCLMVLMAVVWGMPAVTNGCIASVWHINSRGAFLFMPFSPSQWPFFISSSLSRSARSVNHMHFSVEFRWWQRSLLTTLGRSQTNSGRFSSGFVNFRELLWYDEWWLSHIYDIFCIDYVCLQLKWPRGSVRVSVIYVFQF